MSLVISVFGIATLLFLTLAYFVSVRSFTLGAMSLPAMLLMTSFIYFYMMPLLSFADGPAAFLGMNIQSLEWPHLAVGLYALGAIAACLAARNSLVADPAQSRAGDGPLRMRLFWALLGAVALATLAQMLLGRLNVLSKEDYNWTDDVSDLAFINLFFTMMVPLAIVYLVRDDFGQRSLILLATVCFVLLMTGFRYRLVFVAFAVVVSFVLVRGRKVRTLYVVIGTLVGLLGSNIISNSRTYGAGIDVSRLEGIGLIEVLQSFGGEIGPLFTFSYITENPLPPYILAEPWVIAVARLVPSFIWSSKPYPDYLYVALEGFPIDARAAGVAFPQHVEMLLQFGWAGLPVLAFLYFSFAIFLLRKLSQLGREVRVASWALVPIFFGFYMPTRGYFFQILADGLFTFGPLFLLHLAQPKSQAHALELGSTAQYHGQQTK